MEVFENPLDELVDHLVIAQLRDDDPIYEDLGIRVGPSPLPRSR